MSAMTPTDHMERAIKIAGSEAKLGDACGVSQAAIWKAKKVGRVSAELAVRIERATDRQVTCADLRPDLWPVPMIEAPPLAPGLAPAPAREGA